MKIIDAVFAVLIACVAVPIIFAETRDIIKRRRIGQYNIAGLICVTSLIALYAIDGKAIKVIATAIFLIAGLYAGWLLVRKDASKI